MFGLSWIEIFIILLVALLVIGPDKLPEVARGCARVIRQVQRLVSDVRESIHMEEFEAKVRESSHYTPPANPSEPPRVVDAAMLAESPGAVETPEVGPVAVEPAPTAHPAALPVVASVHKDALARS
ncbi:MAG: twin-arginine translocase TatA/TatE family subunit [Magnetococcales bacterium]|nr:twin-arginine translocase TatA/TatE family subunit [Magnetococcales bacterium]